MNTVGFTVYYSNIKEVMKHIECQEPNIMIRLLCQGFWCMQI